MALQYDDSFYQDLLEVTKGLNTLYDKQLKEKRVEALIDNNPDLSEVPREWLDAIIEGRQKNK